MPNIEDISYGAGRELKENNEKLNTTESYFVVNGDNDVVVHATDGKLLNIGKTEEVTGDVDIVSWLSAPPIGKQLIIKGGLIHGEGNAGETHIESSNQAQHLLTLYHANSSNLAPSGEINVIIDEGQGIRIRTQDRAGKRTFIGISYRVISTELGNKIKALNSLV